MLVYGVFRNTAVLKPSFGHNVLITIGAWALAGYRSRYRLESVVWIPFTPQRAFVVCRWHYFDGGIADGGETFFWTRIKFFHSTRMFI